MLGVNGRAGEGMRTAEHARGVGGGFGRFAITQQTEIRRRSQRLAAAVDDFVADVDFVAATGKRVDFGNLDAVGIGRRFEAHCQRVLAIRQRIGRLRGGEHRLVRRQAITQQTRLRHIDMRTAVLQQRKRLLRIGQGAVFDQLQRTQIGTIGVDFATEYIGDKLDALALGQCCGIGCGAVSGDLVCGRRAGADRLGGLRITFFSIHFCQKKRMPNEIAMNRISLRVSIVYSY